jgi:hypothetical protein
MDITSKVQKQFNHLIGKYQGKLSRPRYKFLRQMSYGILTSRHVHVNKISSQLGESIRLKKTSERLSRHLGQEDLEEELMKAHIEIHRHQIRRCRYLIADLIDISKRYAWSMEGLEKVYDGSEDKTAYGYWLLNLVAVDSNGECMIPAYSQLYALKHPDECEYSENGKILEGIHKVQDVVGREQIIVIDRGGDRRVLMEDFLRNHSYFIIRQDGNRDLHSGEKREPLKDIARRVKLSHRITITKYRHGKIRKKHFDCGAVPVYLPRERGELYWPEVLWLVVAKQKGKGYCWFLCRLPVSTPQQAIEMAMEGYGLRWKIEEVHRQVKSDYHLEAICLQRYQALKNFNVIFWVSINLIYYHFDKWRLQLLTQKEIKVCYQEKWWEYQGFVYYKISRVISHILATLGFKTVGIFQGNSPTNQLALNFE